MGGFITANAGSAADANDVLVPKEESDRAMDAAACIGCGACVASCKNASAMLFVAAKVSHLGHLPQGQPERDKRVLAMVPEWSKYQKTAPNSRRPATMSKRMSKLGLRLNTTSVR